MTDKKSRSDILGMNNKVYKKLVLEQKSGETVKSENRVLKQLRSLLYLDREFFDRGSWENIEDALSEALQSECLGVTATSYRITDLFRYGDQSPIVRKFLKLKEQSGIRETVQCCLLVKAGGFNNVFVLTENDPLYPGEEGVYITLQTSAVRLYFLSLKVYVNKWIDKDRGE